LKRRLTKKKKTSRAQQGEKTAFHNFSYTASRASLLFSFILVLTSHMAQCHHGYWSFVIYGAVLGVIAIFLLVLKMNLKKLSSSSIMTRILRGFIDQVDSADVVEISKLIKSVSFFYTALAYVDLTTLICDTPPPLHQLFGSFRTSCGQISPITDQQQLQHRMEQLEINGTQTGEYFVDLNLTCFKNNDFGLYVTILLIQEALSTLLIYCTVNNLTSKSPKILIASLLFISSLFWLFLDFFTCFPYSLGNCLLAAGIAPLRVMAVAHLVTAGCAGYLLVMGPEGRCSKCKRLYFLCVNHSKCSSPTDSSFSLTLTPTASGAP
jgi:hypothetical protein